MNSDQACACIRPVLYVIMFTDYAETNAMQYIGLKLLQVLVAVTADWHVMCYDHNLRLLWAIRVKVEGRLSFAILWIVGSPALSL